MELRLDEAEVMLVGVTADDMVANSKPSYESDLRICAAGMWYVCLSLDRFTQIALDPHSQ